MFDRLKKFFKKIDCVSSCCNKKTEQIMIIRCVSCSEFFKHSSLCLDCFLQHAPQSGESRDCRRPKIPSEWVNNTPQKVGALSGHSTME